MNRRVRTILRYSRIGFNKHNSPVTNMANEHSQAFIRMCERKGKIINAFHKTKPKYKTNHRRFDMGCRCNRYWKNTEW